MAVSRTRGHVSLSCTENAMLEVEVNREVLRLVLDTILTLVHNSLRDKTIASPHLQGV